MFVSIRIGFFEDATSGFASHVMVANISSFNSNSQIDWKGEDPLLPRHLWKRVTTFVGTKDNPRISSLSQKKSVENSILRWCGFVKRFLLSFISSSENFSYGTVKPYYNTSWAEDQKIQFVEIRNLATAFRSSEAMVLNRGCSFSKAMVLNVWSKDNNTQFGDPYITITAIKHRFWRPKTKCTRP